VQGDRLRFDRAEAHHLGRVLRLRPGAVVEATDGRGRLFQVRLVTLDRDGAWGAIVTQGPSGGESSCAITLAQAVLKGARMDWLVQKATELGVARIVPMATARVVVRPTRGAGSGRPARWARIAREAVKQCGRGVVPPVDAPRPLADVLATVPQHDAAWLCWEAGGAGLGAAARAVGQPARLLLLVGPEGGFTPDEVALARGAGATLVSLGPRILRAESAGVTAVALCQFLFGDLGGAVAAGPEAASSPDEHVAPLQRGESAGADHRQRSGPR
jgi:16S rRNA (uracil1498-N3)-methyltransferase